MRFWLFILTLAGIIQAGQIRACAAINNIAYGGFAFVGNVADAKEAYPYCSQLGIESFEKTTISVIDRMLDSKDFRPYQLTKGLARMDETASVMAVALMDESIFRESFGDVHKLVINLGFEILILDFKTMEVRSSIPIYLEFIDSKKEPFSDAEIVQAIRHIITENGCAFETTLTAKLSKISIRDHNAATLQVTEVVLGEKFLSFMPEHARNSGAIFQKSIAARFAALLGTRAGVSMLPYAKDGLNTKMALRFTDASVLKFSIPAPTFAISLNAKGFKKVKSKEMPTEILYIYGSYLGVKVYEPEFNSVFYTGTAKYPVSKIIPASSKGYDEYPILNEALTGSIIEAITLITSDKTTNDKVISKCIQ